MKKQTLKGKLTYLGLTLTAIGSAAKTFGHDVPTDEVTNIIAFISDHWEGIMQAVGLVMGFVGRFRIQE